ncbi:transposase [bacterium]|nr:transposase [bacterium]
MKLTKVIRLEILKPANDDWKTVGSRLREMQRATAQALNHCIRKYYLEAAPKVEELKRRNEKITAKAVKGKQSNTAELGSMFGSVFNSYVYGTIDNIARQRWNTDWFDVMVRGEKSLPSYRRDCPIFVRARGVNLREKVADEFINRSIDIKLQPKTNNIIPTDNFILSNRSFDESRTAIWNRLRSGEYKLGTIQLLYHKRKKKWFVNLSYSFEAESVKELDPNVRVGADLGLAVPVCLAVNNGYGRAYLKEEGESIQSFRRQIERRRNALRRNERGILERRSGHGRKHKIETIEKLRELENNFRRTANHRLSRAVVNFALKHRAGVIVMENLEGFKEEHAEDKFLSSWTYFELQTMIKQKADEVGIYVETVEPKYTSQRCSKCGHIEKANRNGRQFKCCSCGQTFDADYNAARNIATIDIAKIIKETKISEDDNAAANQPQS